mgnify:CR=1 FL=1
MDKVRQNLQKIKDEIYDISNDRVDDDFIKLVKIKDINDELYETLILIHSNYKAEMQAVKTNQIRLISKIVDQNLESLVHMQKTLTEIDNLKKTKGSVFNAKNIALVLLSVASFILFLWFLFSIDGDVTGSVVDTVKAVFGKM